MCLIAMLCFPVIIRRVHGCAQLCTCFVVNFRDTQFGVQVYQQFMFTLDMHPVKVVAPPYSDQSVSVIVES